MPADHTPARRRRISSGVAMIVLALVLVLGLGQTAVWWMATARLESESAAWTAARRVAGDTLTHTAPVRGGWPLEASVTLPQVRATGRLAWPDGTGVSGRLTADALRLSLAPWRPHLLTVDILCPCDVGLGQGPDMPLRAAALRAQVPLVPGVGRTVSLHGTEIALYLPQGQLAVTALRADITRRFAAEDDAPELAVQANARGVTLPPPEAQWPLGRSIRHAAVDLAVVGTLPRGRAPAQALAAWRDGDGGIEVKHLALAWGPATLEGGATLTLDASLQPMGAATMRLSGFAAALDRFAAAGLIGRRAAALARLALTASSRTPEGGGERVVDIPLALEDRTLTAARIPLARLPMIAWPDEPLMPHGQVRRTPLLRTTP